MTSLIRAGLALVLMLSVLVSFTGGDQASAAPAPAVTVSASAAAPLAPEPEQPHAAKHYAETACVNGGLYQRVSPYNTCRCPGGHRHYWGDWYLIGYC